MNFTKTRHDPGDCRSGDHCFWHDLDEPPDGYRCFECKHVYHSKSEVIDAYLRGHPDYEKHVKYAYPLEPVEFDDITFCPLCMHDW